MACRAIRLTVYWFIGDTWFHSHAAQCDRPTTLQMNFCIILERMEWRALWRVCVVVRCLFSSAHPFNVRRCEGQCVHIHKCPADVELSQRHSISVTGKLGNFCAEIFSSKLPWAFHRHLSISRFNVAGVVHEVLNAKICSCRVEINNYIVCQVTVWKCAEYAINSITC